VRQIQCGTHSLEHDDDPSWFFYPVKGCASTRLCVRACVCMWFCVCVVRVFAHARACVCVCVRACVHARVFVCVCVYLCTWLFNMM